ncbi:MAG: hypothetical protein J6A01_10285 [Proteobacteria bacterium]|nr:hypothetical protein [Pseudomonadota bacterium]
MKDCLSGTAFVCLPSACLMPSCNNSNEYKLLQKCYLIRMNNIYSYAA